MVGLDDIKRALLTLPATGPTGFEGLLAAVLEKIAGQPFRLARSGLQAGRDGDTLDQSSHISFECKLYTSSLSSADVQSKITQLIGSANPPDVWALAATVEAGSQLVGVVQRAAARVGLGILILDWPETSGFPPLAVAVAMAAETTVSFLAAHSSDQTVVDGARVALEAFRAEPDFRVHSQPIGLEVRASSLGMANARAANNKWLSEVFADRAKARAALGQALAPNAPLPLRLRAREALSGPIKAHMRSTPARTMQAVVGAEGNGKSWLVAEAWLELEARPLLLVVSAVDMASAAAYGEFRPFLVNQIIRQTSEQADDRVRKRWQRRLHLWPDQPGVDRPRFILWIDGLNEQPTFEWRRWLDDAATQTAQLGGALIVTVRQGFYNERIGRSLNVPITRVNVPGWTSTELDELLREQGVDPQQVAAPVREQLQNPRILGIASRLLSSDQIQSFTELSVGRLLFEHIRASAMDGTTGEAPDAFGRRLAAHAREIIERVAAQQHDDALVFDQLATTGRHVLTTSTLASPAEQFFSALPGEPTLYTLPDGALGLALGFAILETLRRAERNNRDVDEALNELLEPIAALDKTADAVYAALLVASVDEQLSAAIKAALYVGFVTLQNVDDAYFRPFVSIVRSATEAALLANEQLLLGDRSVSNHWWLTHALREVSEDPNCGAVIGDYARKWLSTYSLDPRLAVFSTIRDEGQEAYDAKVAEQAQKITARLSRLNSTESAFIERHLVRRDGDNPGTLQTEACELLAGAPLAPFATQIVACAYSHSLNSSYRDAYEELVTLVRFNQSDWVETCEALLRESDFCRASDASPTAKWALVHILRALSRPEDGHLAEELVEQLTVGRERFGPWRRVESFSASDPCDPGSVEPDNLEQAAQDYAAISVADLTRSRSMGMADHDFKDARPAIARFRPQVGLDKLREYLSSSLRRDGHTRQLAVCSMEPLGSGLDRSTVNQLLTMAAEVGEPRDGESRESRLGWVTAQYAIQAGFPHLSGEEQLEYLMSLPTPGSPLIKFANVLKPASPEGLARLLRQALGSQNHHRALIALSYARHSGTPLNADARSSVTDFLKDTHSSVRALALDIVAYADDAELVKAFVADSWDASELDPREQSFERWYGSLASIEAARTGVRGSHDILDNVVPELFGYAAETLGGHVERDVAARVHAAVARALEIEIPYTPPLATQRSSTEQAPAYGFFDFIEPEQESGFEAFVRRMNETDDEFDARHKSYWESFKNFEVSLTRQDARIIIEDLGDAAISTFIATAPGAAVELARELVGLDRAKAYRLANFALRLAKCVSEWEPELAADLLDRFASETGVISYTFGASSVSLAPLMVWEAADSSHLNELRTRRLDRASSDHDISQEVVAALKAGKAEFLEQYARTKLQSSVPADNARGMMVLGFGMPTPYADEVLNGPTASEGLLGKAQRAALYAYERNVWARKWFDDMSSAETSEEFWAKSVLFLKIIDGRFDVWVRQPVPKGSVTASYLPGIGDEIRRRTNAWKSHREKTLCGDKVPASIFTAQAAQDLSGAQ